MAGKATHSGEETCSTGNLRLVSKGSALGLHWSQVKFDSPADTKALAFRRADGGVALTRSRLGDYLRDKISDQLKEMACLDTELLKEMQALSNKVDGQMSVSLTAEELASLEIADLRAEDWITTETEGSQRSSSIFVPSAETQYVFEEAAKLKEGAVARLSLKSHPGMGVGKMFSAERTLQDLRYILSDGCPVEDCVSVRFQDKDNQIKLADEDLVLEVRHGQICTLNSVNFVRTAAAVAHKGTSSLLAVAAAAAFSIAIQLYAAVWTNTSVLSHKSTEKKRIHVRVRVHICPFMVWHFFCVGEFQH